MKRKRMKKNIMLLMFCFVSILSAHTTHLKNSLWPAPNFPFYVDFLESVAGTVEFGWDSPDDDKWFATWKANYEQNHLGVIIPSKQEHIPKIIHQIWLNTPDNPLPEKYHEMVKSWHENHPDWEYKLWTMDDVEDIDLGDLHPLFNAAINYGQKSDILRYWILYNIGGLYADVDMKCLNRFDLLHHSYDFYIGMSTSTPVGVGIGLIGSQPNHPLMKHIIDSLVPTGQIKTFLDILHKTGPIFFCKKMMEVFAECPGKTMVFPRTYFYPCPNTKRNLSPTQQDAFIRPESLAIHYWTCSWMKREAFTH